MILIANNYNSKILALVKWYLVYRKLSVRNINYKVILLIIGFKIKQNGL